MLAYSFSSYFLMCWAASAWVWVVIVAPALPFSLYLCLIRRFKLDIPGVQVGWLVDGLGLLIERRRAWRRVEGWGRAGAVECGARLL